MRPLDRHPPTANRAASEVEALWLEYEAAASPEALLVKVGGGD